MHSGRVTYSGSNKPAISARFNVTHQDNTTHFGYETVNEREKAGRVRQVFDSVATKYDIMNDLMSGGLHRLWKIFTIGRSGVRPGMKVLDIAGGTGDLAKAFSKKVGPSGEVWLTDINNAMLTCGRDRLLNAGTVIKTAQCDAEKLPFPDGYFDIVTVAFGLRNMTHKDGALAETRRVLKPGGKLMVLEFSKVTPLLAPIYDFYSFKVIPQVGQIVAQDADSYRYLAESIRMHPDQETLKQMMEGVGFDRVQYHNLTGGVVALHIGDKF
jgi:demethylmenaquinone methyltransferase / 2-methoxy-6-polyprenyl-1,4-benzoquinol methylase